MAGFDGTSAPTVKVQFVKSGVWTDVASTDLLLVNIERGRERPDDEIDPGTCTIVLDNRSGIYDPDYTAASTWVVGGVSILRANLQMRVVATWAGVPYIQFAGFLETPNVDQGFENTVTFTFVDGLALFGEAVAPSITVTAGPRYQGETTSTRATRLLDQAGWPAGDRSISGSVQLNTDKQGRPMLTMLRECALAEGGKFYISRAGVARLETRDSKFSKPTVLEFSDARPQPSNTVEYSGIVTQPGTMQLVNQSIIKRTDPLYPDNGREYTATYTSSANAYGTRTVSYEIPVFSLVTAKKLSWFYARKDAQPDTRLTSISFDAMNLGTLYPDFLSADLGDQIIVNRTTMDGRTVVWYVAIEGIEHVIDPEGGWTVRYATSPLNPYTF